MQQISQKSKKAWLRSTVGGETGNETITVMWRKQLAALLKSSEKL